MIKLGGRAQADPRTFGLLVQAWRDSEGSLCVVHGGGDEVSAMQRVLGRKPEFVGGRRVTSKSDLDLLRMVLSGVVNKRIVNQLLTLGVPAVGLSGEDGALITAEIIDSASLGFAGRPIRVNVRLLRAVMESGNLPVISPVAFDGGSAEGGALNVNGDDAAAAIAGAIRARELSLIADVEGVRGDGDEVIKILSAESIQGLIESGIAVEGMAAKLEAAKTALLSGVDNVRICGLTGLVDDAYGTIVTQSQGVPS
ncbi:MAG: acetylglutamate kinase [Gemmatimonadaceae bacterium]